MTGKCSCRRGYFLTDQGCVTCQEAIGDCGQCSVTSDQITQMTQIPMANEFLQPNGKYLQCVRCVDDKHYLAR